MPQRLKTEVRERILAAAAEVFAEHGFRDAKLVEVAQRAATATSNIYKYYENKEELFNAVVSPALAAQFLRLLRTRIRELGQIDNWPGADAQGSEHARAFLSFCVENRHVVLILLQGARGTRYAHIRGLVINEMERLATDFLHQKRAAEEADPHMRFILGKLFSRTVETIADILTEYEDARSTQTAFALFWRYQLSGLEALLKDGA
ncbi:helix-turn-helix domain-containing protein [Roseibium sp. SCPC15]|uniref:TetR/AcrR family transcriptional regulator n=1 Tax=Roseibium sp. SCP15 TaxID=3141376 RepID=UPI00333B7B94